MKQPNWWLKQKWLWITMGLILLLLIVLGALIWRACNPETKPIVVINAPVGGSQFGEGQAIVVQSTTTDPKGIVKVILSVDNLVVQDRIDPPQTAIQRNQTWNAQGVGQHTITVIIVPASAPTPTPAPPAACVNASALVSDNITVPDGATMQPGQAFNKVWRVLNAGNCPCLLYT
ncbi:MAG: Ig-like domain-containing protein, partial [Anaerolineae bacterium]|nr:Ig-like domain-containing protein [Anaerolineae bacterium]